jgi:hypothetical protein
MLEKKKDQHLELDITGNNQQLLYYSSVEISIAI